MTTRSKLLLSFDVEEFDLPEEYGVPVADEPRIDVSRRGMRRILDVLEETGCRATMFITGYFAERCPEELSRMVSGGHEIASHGMNHSHFDVSDLSTSKALLERLTGKTVTGFRMARLAPVAKEDILGAGYVYESSLNPVWLPGRYNNFRSPLKPFQEGCGLWQFPVSAVPWVRFPLFWLSFKNLPLWMYRMMCKMAISSTGYFNMYSHPWEYCELSRSAEWKIPSYITRHAGEEQGNRLKALIERLRKVGDFQTFQEYMSSK